jgi:hypothetical protein
MRGDPGQMHPAAIYLDEEQHVEHGQAHRSTVK